MFIQIPDFILFNLTRFYLTALIVKTEILHNSKTGKNFLLTSFSLIFICLHKISLIPDLIQPIQKIRCHYIKH